MFTGLAMLAVAARLEFFRVDREILESATRIRMIENAELQKAVEAVSSYIVIYDVRDIEFIVRKYDRVPQMMLDESDQNTPSENHAIRGKNAIEIVKKFIAPEVWDSNPNRYSISYWEGLVIVRAPKEVHNLLR